MGSLALFLSWLLTIAEAQLYEYGIRNPLPSVVDVFDVPQSRGSSHCYDNQGTYIYAKHGPCAVRKGKIKWARICAIKIAVGFFRLDEGRKTVEHKG